MTSNTRPPSLKRARSPVDIMTVSALLQIQDSVDNFASVFGTRRGASKSHTFSEEVRLMGLRPKSSTEANLLLDSLTEELQRGEAQHTLDIINALKDPCVWDNSDAMSFFLVAAFLDHLMEFCDTTLPMSFLENLLSPFSLDNSSVRGYCEDAQKHIFSEIRLVLWNRISKANRKGNLETVEDVYRLCPGKDLAMWNDKSTADERAVAIKHAGHIYGSMSAGVSSTLKQTRQFHSNDRKLQKTIVEVMPEIWERYVRDSAKAGKVLPIHRLFVENLLMNTHEVMHPKRVNNRP